jgi:hypothetical protein
MATRRVLADDHPSRATWLRASREETKSTDVLNRLAVALHDYEAALKL